MTFRFSNNSGRVFFVGPLVALLLAAGCASTDKQIEAPPLAFPETWERLDADASRESDSQCEVGHDTLASLLEQAMEQNLGLQTLRSQMEEARLGVTIARADRLPSLSASFSAARSKSQTALGTETGSRFSLGADALYEVDVWRSLSDAQRRAQLLYRAAEFDYLDARRELAQSVSSAWYTAIFARELAGVLERRVESVRRNLEIVEQAYRQGINTALDVYLARTSFAQEQSRLASQQQTVLESVAALQLLLTEYPSGSKALDVSLPELVHDGAGSGPQWMIDRRPDVQAAWTELLAQDAAVAVAHKQRFPQFLISASLDDSGSRIGDVVDGDSLLWSALAGVTQPVFQAGRLSALEDQARERLEQLEFAYLNTLQDALGEVEDALSNRRYLKEQVEASKLAVAAADAAYELSFQEYQRGLVTYTTVLQSEQRAFDATSGLLQLRYLQLVNRVELCAALGGQGASS